MSTVLEDLFSDLQAVILLSLDRGPSYKEQAI